MPAIFQSILVRNNQGLLGIATSSMSMHYMYENVSCHCYPLNPRPRDQDPKLDLAP